MKTNVKITIDVECLIDSSEMVLANQGSVMKIDQESCQQIQAYLRNLEDIYGDLDPTLNIYIKLDPEERYRHEWIIQEAGKAIMARGGPRDE